MTTFMQSFDFANRTVSMLLGCEEQLVEWGPPLGPPVNECAPTPSHALPANPSHYRGDCRVYHYDLMIQGPYHTATVC